VRLRYSWFFPAKPAAAADIGRTMSLCKKPAVAIFVCAMYFGALLVAEAAPSAAEDPCTGFKWDVSRERALFGASAQEQPAGKDSAVVFDLDPKRRLPLQFSAASQALIRLTVTRVLVE
jgi:hypothetical protein